MKKAHILKKLHPSLRSIIATSVIIAMIFFTHLVILPWLDVTAKSHVKTPDEMLDIYYKNLSNVYRHYNYSQRSMLKDIADLSCDSIEEITEVQSKEYMSEVNFIGSRKSSYYVLRTFYRENTQIEYIKKLSDSLCTIVLRSVNADGKNVYYALFFKIATPSSKITFENFLQYTGVMLCVNPSLVSRNDVAKVYSGNINKYSHFELYPKAFKCEYPFVEFDISNVTMNVTMKDLHEENRYVYGHEYHLVSGGIVEFTADKSMKLEDIRYYSDNEFAALLEQTGVSEFIEELRALSGKKE